MKKMFKKFVSLSVAAVILASATALQAFAGAAKGDEYELGDLDVSQATVKPTISITQETIAEGEYKAHPIRTIDVTISGATGKYDNAGFSVKVDDRLKLVKDDEGYIAEAGPALKRSMFECIPEGDNGFRVIIASAGAKNGDGVMFSFQVELPEGIKYEKFPIEIYYNKETDLFTNEAMDEEGKLMEAWIFTQGIEHGYIEVYGDLSHDRIPKGDVNYDRKVDSVDASMILALYAKISTGKTEPTEKQLKEYDYNEDGSIDSADASKVLAYYAANSTSTK